MRSHPSSRSAPAGQHFASLDDWLAWQESLHVREIDLGLERVRSVAERLALSVPLYPVISVAGTNGKGSSIALLVSILAAAGYRVGAYTSPHLRRYNERVQIGGHSVSDKRLCAAFERVEHARGDTPLTYFEFGTLAALEVFGDADLDIGILEVGLGGRLDAVNLVDADVALITTIAIDHVAWLGGDRESIGREKAGIFRPSHPAVYAEPDPAVSGIAVAAGMQTKLQLYGRDFQYELDGKVWHWSRVGNAAEPLRYDSLPRPRLNGDCQIQNAAGVLAVLDTLRDRFPVSDGAIRLGLSRAFLSGRFEIVAGPVQHVLDVAHNAQAAKALARRLDALQPAARTYAVVGMLMDKDAVAVLTPLASKVDRWFVGGVKSARGAAPAELAEVVRRVAPRVPVSSYKEIVTASQAATRCAAPGDRIVVFGSFLSVGAVLKGIQPLADQHEELSWTNN